MNPRTDLAAALAAALASQESTTVFTIPGTQNVELLEALEQRKIRLIAPTDEMSAVFAAIGYSRAAHIPGIALVIPGPGFMFALPAVAEAQHDAVPLVLISGICHEQSEFQRVEQQSIIAPLVKDVLTASTNNIDSVLLEALKTARTGRPGPVYVELSTALVKTASLSQPSSHPDSGDLSEFLTALATAERPLLFVGQGAEQCSEEIRDLHEMLSCPAFSNSAGRGIISDKNPNFLIWDSSLGETSALNSALDRADLVVILGCILNHNSTAGHGLALEPQKIIRIDAAGPQADPYQARIHLTGDCRFLVAQLVTHLRQVKFCSSWRGDEIATIRGLIEEERQFALARVLSQLSSPGLIREVYSQLQLLLDNSTVVVGDSGRNQTFTRTLLQFEHPGQLVVPHDFQSMRFGLPAALGAAVSGSVQRIVAIVGDGAARMSLGDLHHLSRVEGCQICVIVLSDNLFGLIHAQQLRDGGKAVKTALSPIRWDCVAEAFGLSYHLTHSDQVHTLADQISGSESMLVEVPLRASESSIRKAELSSSLRSLIANRFPPLWRGAKVVRNFFR